MQMVFIWAYNSNVLGLFTSKLQHLYAWAKKKKMGWGKNRWFFYPFCPAFLSQGHRLCGTFCIKNPWYFKHVMRSEQLSETISPTLTTRLLMYTTFPYDRENPSHVAQKASEWAFFFCYNWSKKKVESFFKKKKN